MTQELDDVEMELPSRQRHLRYYLLGIIDGEGCFSLALKRQASAKFGWVLDPVFHVAQHKKNRFVLDILQRELRCGRVRPKYGQPDTMILIVDNRRQIGEILLPYLRKYKPLVKRNEFEIFAGAVEALERGDHHDYRKFRKLVADAFTMNYEGKQRRHDLREVL